MAGLNNAFVGNFTTGRPYYNPTVSIAKPQMNINVPNFNLPKLPNDEPTDEPTDEPVNDPNEKNPPVDEPPVEDVPWWEKAGKEIEQGAEKDTKAIESGGEDVIEGIVHSPVARGAGEAIEAAPKVIQSEVLPTAESIGAGMGEGAAELAPIAAGTIALGGGPEDPIGDIGAGAEEVGGMLGGGAAAILSRFF